jgi:DtxR family transcriptional regulator, Mn-dependent transcriptional regulator
MDKLSATVEDYLSLIYALQRDNMPVIGSHLAEVLGVSPPTVTNTLKRLVRDGFVTMDDKGTRLTKKGLESARTVVRRHMLTEWMVVRHLPWSKLHREAHNLEHAISAETEAALVEELGHPETCPHGNPLPGFERAVARWIPLTQASAGDRVIIRRVHELAEHNDDLMAFLEENGILTGVPATVTRILPFNQTIQLRLDSREVTLGFAAARYIFVEK